MIKIIFRRLLQLIVMGWSVSTLTFILMKLLGGNTAYRIAAGRYGDDGVTTAAANLVRQELGLDQPVWLQYLHWLKDLAQLNLGKSFVSNAPIIDELSHQLSYTLVLAFSALVIAAIIALPFGTWLGISNNKFLDKCSLFVSIFLRAQPVFCVGLILIFVFALDLHWLPVAGFSRPEHLILPAFTLALTLAAVSNRVVASSTHDVLRSGYFQFARMKGLSLSQAYRAHGVRNIAMPVVAFMGVQLISLIEGVIMIESLFAWPGIGHALSHAVFSRDLPMLQGAAFFFGIAFVSLNTVIDLCCYWLNPRGQREIYQ
ncbi:ABC transporter permease [Klebsiella aerogenes]|uniref:ABC transporter permease n=1 Tax=Klebsiella aerogenes TaxID=548 RepID=A0AAP9QZB7_KLEAE|nr:ABC transporter permease [Klebsiella aerogenes]QMR41595.1 ABC transporter permease [Klebsiella aerogenes]HAV1831401.1 ABC transporter permease [Enterobacter hormaechei subsp. steigerwaltii]